MSLLMNSLSALLDELYEHEHSARAEQGERQYEGSGPYEVVEPIVSRSRIELSQRFLVVTLSHYYTHCGWRIKRTGHTVRNFKVTSTYQALQFRKAR